MGNKFFAELSRRLNIDGIESSAIDKKRLEVFLHGQPVLFVSPANDVSCCLREAKTRRPVNCTIRWLR